MTPASRSNRWSTLPTLTNSDSLQVFFGTWFRFP